MAEHDEQCERLSTFFLCHCAKRARLNSGNGTELPQLWVSYPVCSGCHQEVEHDGDVFTCPRCHVAWREYAGDGDAADHFTDDYDTPDKTLEQLRAEWIERYPQATVLAAEGNGQ